MHATPDIQVDSPAKARPSIIRMIAGLLVECVLVSFVVFGALTAIYFPYDSDLPLSKAEMDKTRDYYAQAYTAEPVKVTEDAQTERYTKFAKEAAAGARVEEKVSRFVRDYHLERKKVLDVGAGQGYLQDIVEDYTGLDISSSVQRFFHKPFVLGSATAMPFADNTFDAVWSVWVLEHIPAPEQALHEIRRVVRPGGYIFLMPAWNCMPWQADGLNSRPYADLGVGGKLGKAVIIPRLYLHLLAQLAIRPVRDQAWKMLGGPTQLRYTRLKPNYETYWETDSDAVNSLNRFETALWFASRGDRWLDGGPEASTNMTDFQGPLLLQVRKENPVATYR